MTDYLSDVSIEPTIIEDRVGAVLKSEYPKYHNVKVNLSQIEIRKTVTGPEWDTAAKDAVAYPISEMCFTIECAISHRTDFEYEKIIKD